MTRLKDMTRKTVIFLNEFEHWLFGNWITDIGKLKITCRFFSPLANGKQNGLQSSLCISPDQTQ